MSIVIEGVSKSFGSTPVVEHVSLEIEEGELFVLLGASGSGKSTLLRLIAGLALPDAGRIVLDGKDVTTLPPQARGTGFVFQNYSLFRHMNTAQNVEFGLKIRKVPPAERQRRQEELLDLVGLSGFGGRYAHELSGGQQQRVALARALAYQPSVLLLDEPFGALDVKIRSQLRRTFKEIQERLGITTILVTHDQDEAFELAHRIGVMSRGRLLEVGTGESLYRRPQSLFVATFLGAGTVLAGRAANGKARFGPLVLDIPPEAPHEEGAPVRCLFRPEDVVLTPAQPDGTAMALGEGIISEQSFSGAVRRVRIRLPRTQGIRQLAPVAPFGEDGILVDAVVPAEVALPAKTAWVSLRAWSILREPQLRVLVADDGARASAATELARQLSEALHAATTVLGVAASDVAAEALRATLRQRLEEAGLTRGEARVRRGDVVEQILREQDEELYELTVLAANDDGARRRLGATVREVLERSQHPVLVAKGALRKFERILICTAGGEPAKTSVSIGGRLARLLQAKVTLLHVARDPGGVNPFVRRHLDRAAAALRAMDLEVEVRTPWERSVLRGILGVTVAHGQDLIVLGRQGPQRRFRFGLDDITRKVVASSPVPLLVVPTEEG